MIISNSSVAMAAASQATSITKVKTTQLLQINAGKQNQVAAEAGSEESASEEAANSVKERKDESRQQAMQRLSAPHKLSRFGSKYDTGVNDYRLELLRRMIKIWTGKDIKFNSIEEMQAKLNANSNGGMQQQDFPAVPPQRAEVTFSNVTTTTVEVYEGQQVSFNAQGSVTTADGKTFNIDMSLNMSSEFYAKFEHTSVAEFAVRLCDPLVINFNAGAAVLSDDKFEFDLDCDGTVDQISKLMAGSGFLAYDKNGDGAINDGSELFGTKSGDGFKDLSAYDLDGNGWIDEADDIFNKLRVWVTNDDGTNTLFALGEAGIGAIYLGNVATNYTYGYGEGTNGVLRSTGIFLRENGSAGTIQHVDLAL